MAQIVKNLPAIRETWVRSLDWEDLLRKGMATPSSILAWRIPTVGYSPWAHKELGMTEQQSKHTHAHAHAQRSPYGDSLTLRVFFENNQRELITIAAAYVGDDIWGKQGAGKTL